MKKLFNKQQWTVVFQHAYVGWFVLFLSIIWHEAHQYPGFMGRYLLPFKWSLLITILGYGYIVRKRYKLTPSFQVLQYAITYALAPLLLTSIIFTRTELNEPGNYIYNTYKFSLPYLWYLVFVFIVLKAIDWTARYYKNIDKLQWKEWLIIAAITLLVFIQGNDLSTVLRYKLNRFISLVGQPSEQRVNFLWPDLAPYMKMVVSNTPETAIILHPPREYPWPQTGNQYVIRRWLYPRVLLDPWWVKEQSLQPTHVLVDNGGQTLAEHPEKIGWPLHIIPTEKTQLLFPYINNVSVGLPSCDDTQLEGTWSIASPHITQEKVVADSYSFVAKSNEVSPSMIWFTAPIEVTEGKSCVVEVLSNMEYSTGVVYRYQTSEGSWQEIVSSVNQRVNTAETLGISAVLDQIQVIETAAGRSVQRSYQVELGVNVTYRRAMPYLYGQGLITVAVDPIPRTSRECSDWSCVPTIESAIANNQKTIASELITRLELHYPFDPYVQYLKYISTGTADSLANAAKYWSSNSQQNLPKRMQLGEVICDIENGGTCP